MIDKGAFYDQKGQYTVEGNELRHSVESLIDPIIKDYLGRGYSLPDILCMVDLGIQAVTATMVIADFLGVSEQEQISELQRDERC